MEDNISELERLKIKNKKLRQKLNDSKRFPFYINTFKKALNNISDCVFIVGPERSFSFTNDGFNKTLGYHDESVIGKPTNIIFGDKTGKHNFDQIYKSRIII